MYLLFFEDTFGGYNTRSTVFFVSVLIDKHDSLVTKPGIKSMLANQTKVLSRYLTPGLSNIDNRDTAYIGLFVRCLGNDACKRI